jgi:hypothetical protein
LELLNVIGSELAFAPDVSVFLLERVLSVCVRECNGSFVHGLHDDVLETVSDLTLFEFGMP